MTELFGRFAALRHLDRPRPEVLAPFEGRLGALYAQVVAAADDDIGWFAERLPAGGARVLDLCCGAGRSSLRFARAGASVTGVDLSATLLDVARADVEADPAVGPDRVRLIQADVTSLSLGTTFDAVVLGGLSLTLFDERQRELVYRAARAHLEPGASLLLDHTPLMSDDVPQEHVVSMPVRDDDGAGVLLVGTRREPAHRRQSTNMFAALDDQDGCTRRYLTGFSFRLDDPRELTAELARHGFELVERHRELDPVGEGPPMARDFLMASRS
jgi:SAM-dependent methyltransferase